jgi:hypothetical protein
MFQAGPRYVHTLTKWLGLLVSTEEMNSAYKMLIRNSERKCRRGLFRIAFTNCSKCDCLFNQSNTCKRRSNVIIMHALVPAFLLAIVNHGFQPNRVTVANIRKTEYGTTGVGIWGIALRQAHSTPNQKATNWTSGCRRILERIRSRN